MGLLEPDTFFHSWEALSRILGCDATDGILVDIGLPVQFEGVSYSCRAFCLDRKIVLLKPKTSLAHFRLNSERKYFEPWTRDGLACMELPSVIVQAIGQKQVPFGAAIVKCNDARVAAESFEELFAPNNLHENLVAAGVDIICNGDCTHHELRKVHDRRDRICEAVAAEGVAYMYSNQRGCSGGKKYYNGGSFVVASGNFMNENNNFGIEEVDVLISRFDLDAVRASRQERKVDAESSSNYVQSVSVDFCLARDDRKVPNPIAKRQMSAVEEMSQGPPCWLWDFLRRSNASGFYLPLSGGADSATVAALVKAMCDMVWESAQIRRDNTTASDIRRIFKTDDLPRNPSVMCNSLLHTCYMGTENSSQDSRDRANALAKDINSYHITLNIDTVVTSMMTLVHAILGFLPRFGTAGGTMAEDLALQNVQARIRMVMSYLFASLTPVARKRDGFLLMLGTGNVDECLRGYLTKYDCSSSDINPIGGMTKLDIKQFMAWGADIFRIPTLKRISDAPPSAELRPAEGTPQTDEQDMGMTYEELGIYGRLRIVSRCGPLSMYRELRMVWQSLSPKTIAEKVKLFFSKYATNRHKCTVLTPSYAAEVHAPDPEFDCRPFLYSDMGMQFRSVDDLANNDI
eukprot:GHVO01050260.1.p1 GENE.GHVO01050260.1~~GHVO01050260.1.p1  ORF type:complete len:631 (+),score=74.02 GHVO01050260.1:1-1893(+)